MSKLVSANFSRLFRNKFFWIGLALVVGIAAFIAIDFRLSYSWSPQYFSNETIVTCFKYTPILAGIVALFGCLFIGEEYSNKTIRNKIASGYSKARVYGANWLVCAVTGILFYVVFFLTIALPIAPWAQLMKYNGYIITRILKRATVNMFAVLAIVSVSVFIAMLMKNRIVGIVVTLICMLVLFVAAEIMVDGIKEKTIMVTDSESGLVVEQANPDYEPGAKQAVIQMIMDVQPFGQILQAKIGRLGWAKEGAQAILLPIYSCLVSLLFSLGGAYLFGKRDLE